MALEPLKLEGSTDEPKIIFDKAMNKFEISGKSFPDDAGEFYLPVLDWVKRYSEQPNPQTDVLFKLGYYNTSSSKMILDMFYIFNTMYNKGNKITIKWYYVEDDEDMLEAGEEFADMIDIPFKFITIPN